MDALQTFIAWADLHVGFLLFVATVLGVLVGGLIVSALGRLVQAFSRHADASGRQLAGFSEHMQSERQPNLVLVSKGDRLELVNFGAYPAYIEGVSREDGSEAPRAVVLYVSAAGSDKEVVSHVLPAAASARLSGLSAEGFEGRTPLDILFRYGGTGSREHHLIAEVVSHPDRGLSVIEQGLKSG